LTESNKIRKLIKIKEAEMGLRKDELFTYSNEVGLDLIGVTTADPFDRFLREINSRKEHYMERYSNRIDSWKSFAKPREIFPEAKSVIVMGFYYLTHDKKLPEPSGVVGRIVSYGHLGILKKAKMVQNFLQERGYRAVLGAHRKEAAVRAGLGTIGKNNLILNERYGAWVAYQSIITDAEVEPDEPFSRDLCEDCDLCLRACPTTALYEPGRIDPRRCITYHLTSNDVAQENWQVMDNHILACDVCLEACPKNKGLIPKKDVESLFPDDIGIYFPLKRLFDFTEKSFQKEMVAYIREKLAGKSKLSKLLENRMIERLFRVLIKNIPNKKEVIPETFTHASGKLLIYKRNAIIAAGNRRDKSMVDAVREFVDHPYLGKYARWSVERITQ
jgi:epoxyqueuosine reductase